MTQQSVITDEMRAAIGVESEAWTLEVDRSAIRMFARAVGHTDLIFYDEEFARSQGCRGLVCPPGFFGVPVYRPDRPARMGARVQSPYKRLLNGGTEHEYLEPICAGDVLSATSRLVDISERTSSLGPMLIMVSETVYRNQEGRVVAKSRGTSISY